MVSAAIEAATAIALILAPELVARLLLGTEPSIAGVAAARVAAFRLPSLAIACWPGGTVVDTHAVCALFVYNLLTGLYLGYLRFGAEFVAPCCGRPVFYMSCWR